MNQYDRSKGHAKFEEVYGGELPALPPAGTSPFIDYMLETLFGALWQDPTLSIRERRLLVIGVLAAQGEEGTLALQLRCALKRGELTAAQLQPLATFLTQYVGYPRGSRLFRCATKSASAPAALSAGSVGRRPLADPHQILRAQPLAKSVLYGWPVEGDVALGGARRFIERQPEVGAAEHPLGDLGDAGLTQRPAAAPGTPSRASARRRRPPSPASP